MYVSDIIPLHGVFWSLVFVDGLLEKTELLNEVV